MSSIIEGYNYDIFISYRQKDNKHDGWVTEFVNQLRGELEATFKEDISIYFDENPHDGLLETHSVDKSLEGKLRCLIFIPVISQTYCDPKSYAWQHEFCAFNKLAKEDKFGRDIKLASGNVTSRILPVKIHDLDPEDKTLLENELGGALRCIEFIYKSLGVNRPLNPSDNPDKNLNQTYYRDQINKVANAVKEIISALKKPGQHLGEESRQDLKAKSTLKKNLRSKIIAGSFISLALIVLMYFIIPKLFISSEKLDKSIAVLPFENWNNEEEFQHLGDAIANEISTQLSLIHQFHVISYTSSSQYKESEKPPISQIGKELHANFIIEGTVERQVENVSIHVQVINAADDYHLWAHEFKGKWKDIFTIRANIAKKVAEELNAVLSADEVEKIEKIQTTNITAYDYYLLGRNLWSERSKEGILKAKSLFEKAIDADPEFALAYAALAQLYAISPVYISWRPIEAYPQAMTLALKALEHDSTLAEAYSAIGAVKGSYYWDIHGAIEEFQHAIKLNPRHSTAYHWYAENLFLLGRYEEAVEKLDSALQIDPLSPVLNSFYGFYLYYVKKKDEAISHLQKMIEFYPEIGHFHWTLGLIYSYEGNFNRAIEELQKAVKLSGEPFYFLAHLGEAYSRIGNLSETQRLLDTINARTIDAYTSYFPKAMLLAELGRNEEALDNLQKAYDERMELILNLKYVDLISFSNLRSDPRFIKIMEMVWHRNE
jgi:TolB-like protein/Tfp pilus assembly protein PilF/lambda repressor-like predicted transcriptional regulator